MVSGAVAQDKRVRGVGGVGDFSGKRWNDRRMDREWARAGDGRKRVVFRSGNGVGRGEAAEGRSLVDGGQHPLMIPCVGRRSAKPMVVVFGLGRGAPEGAAGRSRRKYRPTGAVGLGVEAWVPLELRRLSP